MEVLKVFKNGKRISCFVAKMPDCYIVRTGAPSKMRGYSCVNWFGLMDDAISYADAYNEYCKTFVNFPNIRNYPSAFTRAIS